MARYGKKAQSKVKRAMHERKMRHAAQWALGQEGDESQAGHRHRPVRSATRGWQGAIARERGATPDAREEEVARTTAMPRCRDSLDRERPEGAASRSCDRVRPTSD